MVTYDITFEDQQLQTVFDVTYNAGTATEIGTAEIKCANSSHNRQIASGDEVVIRKNGNIDFQGYVTGKPTKGGPEKTDLDIEVEDKRILLKQERVQRAFHNRDTGDIVRDIVDGTTKSLDARYAFPGDTPSEWDVESQWLQRGEVSSKQLYKYDDDFIFIGWKEGAAGEKVAVRKNISPSFQPGTENQVEKFKTRMKVNDSGDVFDVEVAYRDDSGNEYLWPIDIGNSRGFTVYDLPAEQAASDAGNIDDNTIEYRFTILGTLPEKRAAGIDYFSAIPFRVDTRDTPFDTSGVQDTGRSITRKFNKDALSVIHELSVEDNFISYIDKNDVLYYEPRGSRASPKKVDIDTTDVIGAQFDRDYSRVTNEVTVQGAGDIRVTESDQASIRFYGISSRDKAIIDKQIQTEQEARDRAKGYLKKHAWDDVAIEFVIADADYQTVLISDEMTIDWPPENINGTFSVSKKETDKNGIVTLGFTKTV